VITGTRPDRLEPLLHSEINERRRKGLPYSRRGRRISSHGGTDWEQNRLDTGQNEGQRRPESKTSQQHSYSRPCLHNLHPRSNPGGASNFTRKSRLTDRLEVDRRHCAQVVPTGISAWSYVVSAFRRTVESAPFSFFAASTKFVHDVVAFEH
jgi:hypothetical protein